MNGHMHNDIDTVAPGVLPILEEIAHKGDFPPDLKSGSFYQVDHRLAPGDEDDWITKTYQIPSVTSELGYPYNFVGDWVIKSKDMALDLVKSNSHWVDYVAANLPRYSAQLQKEQMNYKEAVNNQKWKWSQIKTVI